jgi:hypothetical protein
MQSRGRQSPRARPSWLRLIWLLTRKMLKETIKLLRLTLSLRVVPGQERKF